MAEFTQRYRRLTLDEVHVFDVLSRPAQGGSIYRVMIGEDELLEAIDPNLDLDYRRHLLANVKSRG